MMNKFSMGTAVLAAVLVAGCGGGSDAAADVQQTSDARGTADERHARAADASHLRAKPASAEAAAEQLFDFAEPTYPAFFPAFVAGSPPTQSAAPFRYRQYPNGVYLGVVVSPAEGYILDGVYMMGGPFGDVPLYVGMLAEFITPTARTASADPVIVALKRR